MKERIVIKDTEQTFNIVAQFPTQVKPTDFEHTKEQVPETWEELKELCENLEQKVNNLIVKFLPPKTHYDCEVIWFKQYGLWVYSKGFVLFKKDIEEDMIGGAKNRTPQQMWGIIKNLIGEE